MSETAPKSRTMRVFDWIERHWGARRAVLSLVVAAPLAIILIGAELGTMRAHQVESAAEVIPADWYEELMQPEEHGFNSPIDAAGFVFIFGIGFVAADAWGRIVHEYLLWIPEGVWGVVFNIRYAVLLLAFLTSLRMVEILTHDYVQLFEGDLDG